MPSLNIIGLYSASQSKGGGTRSHVIGRGTEVNNKNDMENEGERDTDGSHLNRLLPDKSGKLKMGGHDASL